MFFLLAACATAPSDTPASAGLMAYSVNEYACTAPDGEYADLPALTVTPLFVQVWRIRNDGAWTAQDITAEVDFASDAPVEAICYEGETIRVVYGVDAG